MAKNPKRVSRRRTIRGRRIQTVQQRVVYAIANSINDKLYGAKSFTELRKRIVSIANDDNFWEATQEVIKLATKIRKYLGDFDLN